VGELGRNSVDKRSCILYCCFLYHLSLFVSATCHFLIICLRCYQQLHSLLFFWYSLYTIDYTASASEIRIGYTSELWIRCVRTLLLTISAPRHMACVSYFSCHRPPPGTVLKLSTLKRQLNEARITIRLSSNAASSRCRTRAPDVPTHPHAIIPAYHQNPPSPNPTGQSSSPLVHSLTLSGQGTLSPPSLALY